MTDSTQTYTLEATDDFDGFKNFLSGIQWSPEQLDRVSIEIEATGNVFGDATDESDDETADVTALEEQFAALEARIEDHLAEQSDTMETFNTRLLGLEELIESLGGDSDSPGIPQIGADSTELDDFLGTDGGRGDHPETDAETGKFVEDEAEAEPADGPEPAEDDEDEQFVCRGEDCTEVWPSENSRHSHEIHCDEYQTPSQRTALDEDDEAEPAEDDEDADGEYVCVCGHEAENGKKLGGHKRWCDEYHDHKRAQATADDEADDATEYDSTAEDVTVDLLPEDDRAEESIEYPTTITDMGWSNIPDLSVKHYQIMETLDENDDSFKNRHAYQKLVPDKYGIPNGAINRLLNLMVEKGLAEKQQIGGEPQYRITGKGRDAVTKFEFEKDQDGVLNEIQAGQVTA